MSREIGQGVYQKTLYQFRPWGVWDTREILLQTSVFHPFRDGGERRRGYVYTEERQYIRVVEVLPGNNFLVGTLTDPQG